MTPLHPLAAALKIWISGVALGPVLFGLGFWAVDVTFNEHPTAGQGEVQYLLLGWFFMIAGGAICSLPSLLLLWLAIGIQVKNRKKKPDFWVTLLLTTFVLTLGPFLVFGFLKGDNPTLYGLAAAYVGAIWLGVYWVFKGVKTEPEIQMDEPLDANL